MDNSQKCCLILSEDYRYIIYFVHGRWKFDWSEWVLLIYNLSYQIINTVGILTLKKTDPQPKNLLQNRFFHKFNKLN